MKEKKSLVKRILVLTLAVALMVFYFPAPAVRAEESATYSYHLSYFLYNAYWREAVCYSFDVEKDSRIALIYDYSDNGVIDIYGNIGERNIYRPYGIYSLLGRATTTNISGDVIDQRDWSLSGIFCGIDMVTDIPVFATQAEADHYIATGDITGALNYDDLCPDVRDDATDFSIRLKDFRCTAYKYGSYDFSWAGLENSSEKYEGKILEYGSDDFVDIFVGYCPPGEVIADEEVPVTSLYPAAQVLVSSLRASISGQFLEKEGKYLRYIKLVPYHCSTLKDMSGNVIGDKWMKGEASFAYFDPQGNFAGYDGWGGLEPPDPVPDITPDDYYVPEFDTGFAWLDILLNAFVRFVNSILRVLYRIRDMIYNRDGSGILNLLKKLYMWLSNPLYFIYDLFDFLFDWLIGESFSIIFRRLFVPSPDFLTGLYDRLVEVVPLVGQVADMETGILDIIRGASGTAPTIMIPLSRLNGIFGCTGIDDYTVSFDWYDPYRATFHGLISAYLYLRFALSQFFAIKSLFNATAAASDAIQYWGD